MKNIIFPAMLVFCLLISSCSFKSVQVSCGMSDVSQLGINHFQPFIEAMEEFKKDNRKYPQNGLELIPKYIDKIPVIASPFYNYDENKLKTLKFLKNQKLFDEKSNISEDGSYFSIEFHIQDDRICLMGRNNICEYTSETKEWKCYQH